MRIRIAFLFALSTASLAVACGGGSPTTPTAVTPTPVASPAPTPTPTPAPTPAPAPPRPPTLTVSVSPLSAGAAAQGVGALGTQERGVNIKAAVETFDAAIELQTVVCFMFQQEIQFDVPFEKIPPRARAVYDRPMKFSTSFPAPSDDIGTLDCAAEGKDESGKSVTAKATTKLTMNDTSPVVTPCPQGQNKACLTVGNTHLEVSATIVDQSGRRVDARVMSQNAKGVVFYLNDPRQAELSVVIDGCGPNGANVEVYVRAETPFQFTAVVRNVEEGTTTTYSGQTDDKNTQKCAGKK